MISTRAVIGLWSVGFDSFRVLIILRCQVLVVTGRGYKILSVVCLVNAVGEIGGLEGEIVGLGWLRLHLLSNGSLCRHLAFILQC